MEEINTISSKSKLKCQQTKLMYQQPSISILELESPVPLLGLSEVSDERLNAVFNNDYEEEDASEAF